MSSYKFPSRPNVHPKVYAYRAIYSEYEGYLKVGYTERAVEVRVAEQFPVIQPDEIKPYEILFAESAMRSDGTSFTDHDLHRRLERNGFDNVGGEWFRCSAADVRNAWLQVRDRVDYSANRTEDFPMRPEQRTAVEKNRGLLPRLRTPRQSQRTQIPLERQDAFRQDIRQLSACQAHEYEARARAHIQACR